jgi:DNA (cytosine-5)-methyltransferase 1
MKCLDLYAGIGGWTLGMKLSGVEHYASFEWNPESNLTHNVNFGTKTDEVDIRTLTMSELPKPSKIDIVVGSPPCTQFSFANRGGNGDIEDGLVDLHKFLTIVEYLKPKYWAMENVPRVKNIIDTLTTQHPDFRRFAKLISFNEVVNAADFGVPQARKRMICGNFPSELFLSYRKLCPRYTMGEALVQIEGRARADLLFGWKKGTIIDHHKEIPLTEEEIRINREAKLYHPIYNRMSFPDQLDRPARTVTSLCTRISRESIVITSEEGFRRLTVRERATLMGFPINFQFYGNSYSSKLKMIGNAIPPPLTYHIFNAMQHRKYTPLKSKSEYQHQIPEQEPKTTIPPVPKHRFSANRNFRFCIPGFRFGSGVRFELSNDGGIWAD